MSYTFHRALIAALATGAMAASGVAFGAPALAATPAPDAYGPMISNLATTSEGIGGQVTFSVTDNPGLSSIDLRDPATDAIFYHRVVDFPGNVTDDGLHHYLFTIKFSDIQAAWSQAGHTDALPATVRLVAWGSDGLPSKRADVAIEPIAMSSLDFGIESGQLNMTVGQQTYIGVTHKPDNANMTKVNWTGDDIDVLNVDDRSGRVTALKEGCSDVRAVADYMDPTAFDPVMATVQVCASELGKDEIAVNYLRADIEEGETVTLKPLLPEKFKEATLSWSLEYDGVVILKVAEDGKSATITGGNVVDWNQVNLTATLPDGTEASATTIAVVKSVKHDATAPAPWVDPAPQPDPQPQPQPQPQPDPQPQPQPDPQPAPDPQPQPQPEPQPAPDPQPQPQPDPQPQPQPQPQPDPQPAPDPQPQPQPAPSGAWMLDSIGWWYRNADGTYPANTSAVIDGRTYRFDGRGYMRTGWVMDGGTWYYHDASGAQLTGWQAIGGTWYYLGDNGAMRTGWVMDGGTWYYLHGSGAMATGWINLGGTWYYLHGSGAMLTGWQAIGGSWYYLGDNGAMRIGWVIVDGTWYYLRGSGAMATGWINLGGAWYYLSPSGAMVTGTQAINGRSYTFNASGVWIP